MFSYFGAFSRILVMNKTWTEKLVVAILFEFCYWWIKIDTITIDFQLLKIRTSNYRSNLKPQFTMRFLISFFILSILSSCETNSTNESKANSNSNRTNQNPETEIDTSKTERSKESKTEINENNFLAFSDFWKIVRSWSTTEPTENIKIQNQEFRFTNKRLETDENVFVYVRKAPEAILKFKQVQTTDGSVEFRCEFYTPSLQEY